MLSESRHVCSSVRLSLHTVVYRHIYNAAMGKIAYWVSSGCARMADPSLFDQRLAWSSSPYFSVASSVCSLKLPPRSSLARSRDANLRVILLHLGKVCLEVELGVAGVGYYCASNVSMRRVIRPNSHPYSVSSVVISRTIRPSIPRARLPTLDARHL